MTQVNRNGGGGGGGYNPPTKGGGTKSKANLSNPGLITSSGGLFGTSGLLLTPYVNNTTGQSYIIVHDPTNFDCEESAEYDFRQEIPMVQGNPYQEGTDVSCHLIKLKYRELGVTSFSINVTVYRKQTDDYFTTSITVNIEQVKNTPKRTFPDKRIHTRFLSFLTTGERPQVSITRNANSGPMSITSLTLCGNADEVPQQ
jgi:hypothetical protein